MRARPPPLGFRRLLPPHFKFLLVAMWRREQRGPASRRQRQRAQGVRVCCRCVPPPGLGRAVVALAGAGVRLHVRVCVHVCARVCWCSGQTCRSVALDGPPEQRCAVRGRGAQVVHWAGAGARTSRAGAQPWPCLGLRGARMVRGCRACHTSTALGFWCPRESNRRGATKGGSRG